MLTAFLFGFISLITAKCLKAEDGLDKAKGKGQLKKGEKVRMHRCLSLRHESHVGALVLQL